VAEQDGEVVGNALLLEMYWAKEPGRFLVDIGVDRDRWRQGIGSELYSQTIQHAHELGAARLYCHVLSTMPEAERFANKHGFSPTGRVARMSRLDVHAAKLDGYEGVEEQIASGGIRIATLAELGAGDEQVLHTLHDLETETIRDIPMSEEFSSVPYENWRRRVTEAPGASPHSFWVALDGEKPVGLAVLKRQGDNAAWNWYTGVDRAYRRQGVARALKLRTIEWSRQNGVDYIYTGNDVDNQSMLSINIGLGYQPLPAFVEVVRHLSGS
jgi:GNAT superfamily N-acetyltransferase